MHTYARCFCVSDACALSLKLCSKADIALSLEWLPCGPCRLATARILLASLEGEAAAASAAAAAAITRRRELESKQEELKKNLKVFCRVQSLCALCVVLLVFREAGQVCSLTCVCSATMQDGSSCRS